MSLPPFPGNSPEDNSGVSRPAYNADNYAAQQPSGYATPNNTFAGQPAQAPRGRKTAVIVGASVLSLAVLAGGGFAFASVLNQMSDRDISVALPQSTSAFLEADLDPSPGQKINLANVAGKIKDISNSKDYDTNKDPKEMFTDPFFSELDYKTEVEPWIGDKVAFGAWGDLSEAAGDVDVEGDYSSRSKPSSNDSSDMNAVVVYEITNKDKAEEAAKKVANKKSVYEVNDRYLVIAASQSSLDSYNAELAKGTLDKNTKFTDDRKLLNGQDNVAMGWADASSLHADKILNQYMSKTLGGTGVDAPDDLNGRIVTGVSVSDNSLKVSSKLVGFDTNGYTTEAGLSDVKNLPDNSSMALSIKDGKTAATKAWDTYKSVAGSSRYDSNSEFDDQLSEIGITLPDDFGALLGSETSIGASVEGSTGDYGFTYRAKDGDLNKIERILEGVGSDEIQTSDEDGAAVVKYGDNSGGKLGDSQNFKNVTGDLSKAQSLFFVDINKLMHESGENDKHPDVNYGVAGLTSSLDPSSKIVSVDISWAF
jgi:hypothetical protein